MQERKKTVDQLCDDPSFIRWIEGEAGHKEAKKWNGWVQKSEQNRSIAIEAQQKILGIAFTKPELPDIRAEWNKVHHEITEKEQVKVRGTNLKTAKHWDAVSLFFKVAAILVVGLFVGFAAYMYQEPTQVKQEIAVHTVKTDYGEKKTLNLSDGSQIILAANSQLSYKENWLDKPVKEISLKGEAYFNIVPQKTKKHPKLVVKTEDGTASVWGTRFTVDTYGTGTQVVLEEGEVRIDSHEKGEKLTMRPREMATFKKASAEIQLKQVNPRVYTSWFTNELFFDDTPLSVLIKGIERTYGLEVKVQDPTILKKKLSGSVDFKSLKGLTNAVAKIFDIQIERLGEALIINYNKKN